MSNSIGKKTLIFGDFVLSDFVDGAPIIIPSKTVFIEQNADGTWSRNGLECDGHIEFKDPTDSECYAFRKRYTLGGFDGISLESASRGKLSLPACHVHELPNMSGWFYFWKK